MIGGGKKIILAYLAVGMIVCCAPAVMGADGDGDDLDDRDELTLAQTYAPVLYFEGEEQVYPVTATYHIDRSNLNQSVNDTGILIDANPTAGVLGTYTDPDAGYYLDNTQGNVDDDRIIDDYKTVEDALGYTVYAHVFSSGGRTMVQYWLFYAFNRGDLNTHEGDWEMIQVILGTDGVPQAAMYSQHISGQQAPWDEVQKSSTHPKVYVARGSHANYFRSYQGSLGLASDHVGKNGKILEPDDYTIVMLGERGAGNHPTELAWLDFAGRWGDYGSAEDEVRGKRGPYGPVFRENGEMWTGISWGEGLPELNDAMLQAEWFFANFLLIFLFVLAVSLALILYRIYRRYKKDGIEKPYTSLLRINGLNPPSFGNILAIAGVVLAVAALFFSWYAVSVDIQTGSYQTPGTVDVVTVDGMDGVQINLLEENRGRVQLGAFPIAFSLLLAASIVFFVLKTIGLENRAAGRTYLLRAVRFVVPVILILVAVTSLKALAIDAALSGAPEESRSDAFEILSTISSNPLGGDTTLVLDEYGHVDVSWGMGLGAYLLIAAFALLVVAGMLLVLDKKKEG
jgi:hypothetical protein